MGGADKQLQQLIVYFYPEHRKHAQEFMVDFTCNKQYEGTSVITPATSDVTTNYQSMGATGATTTLTEILIKESFDKSTMLSCNMCKKKIVRERTNNTRVPKKVFERNTSAEFEYIISDVIAPIIFKPDSSKIDESKFYQVYLLNKNSKEYRTINDPCFKYNGNDDSKFFAVYSQSHHLHFCNLRNITVIRKSEFHRNVSAFKILPSTKLFRLTGSRRYILIFSFDCDLYIEFPKNNFFNNVNIDENGTTILRLQKSTKDSFNFVVSTQETLENVDIFGEYQTEQAYLGKLSSADNVALEKINNLGTGLLHYMELPADKKKTKYDPMEYACYKAGQIVNKK